ncbi:hypothetical protein pb186bvf_008897 [Paramecium bursaria]
MNNLIKALQNQSSFLHKEEFELQIQEILQDIQTLKFQTEIAKILGFQIVVKYLSEEQISLLLQILIKSLQNKIQSKDAFLAISDMIQKKEINDKYHLLILYFLALKKVYKLKSKEQNDSEILNRSYNRLEERCLQFTQLFLQLNWTQDLITSFANVLKTIPGLFKNQVKQIQDKCLIMMNQQNSLEYLEDIFILLQFTNQESKQGVKSYQGQLNVFITQLFDCFYILSQLINLDLDKQQLIELLKAKIICQEINSIFCNTFTSNAINKSNIYFNIIKKQLESIIKIDQQFIFIEYERALNNLFKIIQAQFEYIKDQVVLELKINDILQNISDNLSLNQSYTEFFIQDKNTITQNLVIQTINGKLTKLMTDRRINLDINLFKYIQKSILQKQITLLNKLLSSTIGQGLIINHSQFIGIANKLITNNFIQKSELIIDCNNYLKLLSQNQFFTIRIGLKYSKQLLDNIEYLIPQLLSNNQQFKKQERVQLQQSILQKQKTKNQKEYSLGLVEQQTIEPQQLQRQQDQVAYILKVLRSQIKQNLRNRYDIQQINSAYKLVFGALQFPFDQILESFNKNGLQELLKFFYLILDNYVYSSYSIIQPIEFFVQFCLSRNVNKKLLQKITNKITIIKQKQKYIKIDNLQAITNALNDQYQKAQVLLQSNSEEIFHSCQAVENGLTIEQRSIKKTKSMLVGEDEQVVHHIQRQPTQSEDMFYSLQNLSKEPNIEESVRNVQQKVQFQIDEEIPQAILD